MPLITPTRGDAFTIQIGESAYTQRKDAGPALRQVVTAALMGHRTPGRGGWRVLGRFGGMPFGVFTELTHGTGQLQAYVGFPDLRDSEALYTVEELTAARVGSTMLGRLSTALEKAPQQLALDREALPGLEAQIVLLTEQQAAVDFGERIDHARRRTELLDDVVAAIAERDKLPELTVEDLDPARHGSVETREREVNKRAEERKPLQAKIDQAVSLLEAFDRDHPAPLPPDVPGPRVSPDGDEAASQPGQPDAAESAGRRMPAAEAADRAADAARSRPPAPGPDTAAPAADEQPAAAAQAPDSEPPQAEEEPPAADTAAQPGADPEEEAPQPVPVDPGELDGQTALDVGVGALALAQPPEPAPEPVEPAAPEPDRVEVPGQMTIENAIEPTAPAPTRPAAESAADPAQGQPEAEAETWQANGLMFVRGADGHWYVAAPPPVPGGEDYAQLVLLELADAWLANSSFEFLNDSAPAVAVTFATAWTAVKEFPHPRGWAYQGTPEQLALFGTAAAATAEVVRWYAPPAVMPEQHRQDLDELQAGIAAHHAALLALAARSAPQPPAAVNTMDDKPALNAADPDAPELKQLAEPSGEDTSPNTPTPGGTSVEPARPGEQEQLDLFPVDAAEEPVPDAADPGHGDADVSELELPAPVVELLPEPPKAEATTNTPLALMEEPISRARRLAAGLVLGDDESLVESQSPGIWDLTIGGERYRVLTWRQWPVRGPRDGHALRAERQYQVGPDEVAWSREGEWAVIVDGCREHATSLGDPGDRLTMGEWVTWTEGSIQQTGRTVRHEGAGRYLVQLNGWFDLPGSSPSSFTTKELDRSVLARSDAPADFLTQQAERIAGRELLARPTPARRKAETTGPKTEGESAGSPAPAGTAASDALTAAPESSPAAGPVAMSSPEPEATGAARTREDTEEPASDAAADDRQWEEAAFAVLDAARDRELETYARTGRVPAAYESLQDWLGDAADQARTMREEYLEGLMEEHDLPAAPATADTRPPEPVSVETTLPEPTRESATMPENILEAPVTLASQLEELPLWEGDAAVDDASADSAIPDAAQAQDAPAQSTDIFEAFQPVADAWSEIVPPGTDSVDDMCRAMETYLRELQEQWQRTVPLPQPVEGPTEAADSAHSHPSPLDRETVQSADARADAQTVNSALRRADEHTVALQDIPEWQELQTVRGATRNLWKALKSRAGEHADRLFGDRRVQEFFRNVSIRTCEKIAGWAQGAADRLRNGQRDLTNDEALPSAEALLALGNAAGAYTLSHRRPTDLPSAQQLLVLGDAPNPSGSDAPVPTTAAQATQQKPVPGQTRVSAAAAKSRSAKPRKAPKQSAAPAGEQAAHLRRGGAETQRGRKPNRR